MTALATWLSPLPLVAILRGIAPDEAAAIGAALVGGGFRAIEVPLNSPRPFDSIAGLAAAFGDRALIGAGTVLDVADMARAADAGARLVVMPHGNARLIAEAKRLGLICVPGVATVGEAFAALDAGADALKLFPAEGLPPAVVKAWRAVLPKDLWLLPVGGITPARMAAYIDAGANGFGLGSALYRPGLGAAAVGERAAAFAAAWAALSASPGGS